MSQNQRLQFGKQISPNQINLGLALGLVQGIPGDAIALHDAIGDTLFPDRDDKPRRTLGMNAFLAMRHYGLVTEDKEYALTALGEDLLKTEDKRAFYDRLGQHILLNLHGLQVVEAVHSLQARGVKVTVAAVAQELTTLGIDSGGDSGENINPLRLLPERAGVFITGKGQWTIDAAIVKKLTGASAEEIVEIVGLSKPQQAFLRALATCVDEEANPRRRTVLVCVQRSGT